MTTDLLAVLDNDRLSYDYCCATAETGIGQAPQATEVVDGLWTEEQAAKFLTADEIKQWCERITDDAGAGLGEPACLIVAQLFQRAMEQVDWHAVADHYLAKCRQSV